MKMLMACEESQVVTKQFRLLGHEAYSCDVVPTSGKNPEWHLEQDVAPLLKKRCDMLIAFPPCTHLAVSGASHFKEKIKDGRQQQGIDFFMEMINAPIDKICVENPIGIMSTKYRKPSQIIQPWMFGDKAQKSTCLWLKNLPLLVPTNIVEKGEFIEFVSKKGVKKRQPKWYFDALINSKNASERSKLRSKTFKGIAKAMATQFTIINQKQLEL